MREFPPSLIGSDPSVIKGFVVSFFRSLDEAGILWAVKHGWEGLPEYSRHDVDLAVEQKNVRKAVHLLRRAARETGWQVYGHFRNSNLYSYWILFAGGNEVSYFQIDIFVESRLRGTAFFPKTTNRAILQKRWKNDVGIWCLPAWYGGAHVLLKEVVANGKLERALRHEQVLDGFRSSPERFRDCVLQTVKDEHLADQIVDICMREAWDELQPLTDAIRKGFMRFRLADVPARLRYIYDYFRNRFFPYMRLFVALVGPDGCGKTTVADGIAKKFDHRPFCGIMRVHSNLGKVIRLREIKRKLCGWVGRRIEFAPDPTPGTKGMGMQAPLSCVRSMCYVLYYGVLLALGRIRLWKWRNFSSIIIADRYYYDYYYMRGHMRSPKWWKDLVGIIVPKPNLVFFLDRSAEEIYAQKPELDVEEIKRQQSVIRDILREDPCARVIDASKGVEDTIACVNSEIEKWLIAQRG